MRFRCSKSAPNSRPIWTLLVPEKSLNHNQICQETPNYRNPHNRSGVSQVERVSLKVNAAEAWGGCALSTQSPQRVHLSWDISVNTMFTDKISTVASWPEALSTLPPCNCDKFQQHIKPNFSRSLHDLTCTTPSWALGWNLFRKHPKGSTTFTGEFNCAPSKPLTALVQLFWCLLCNMLTFEMINHNFLRWPKQRVLTKIALCKNHFLHLWKFQPKARLSQHCG